MAGQGDIGAACDPAALSPLAGDHDYIRHNPAPAYWALAPFLIHQHTDASCSLATAVMLLNGMRAIDGTGRRGRFVSERGLLDLLADDHWRREITPPEGKGLTLAELHDKLARSLERYAITRWCVDLWPVAAADAVATDAFRADLRAMERQGDRLIAGNYHLATTYGDRWDIGHFSPIGAYDAARDRVLLLDVWKADYEPCWIDLARLMRGMAVPSARTGHPRGYLVARRT